MVPINLIALMIVSTVAIISVKIMEHVDPGNEWYVWYVATINALAILLYWG